MIGEELERAGLRVAPLNREQEATVRGTEHALKIQADATEEEDYIIVVYQRVKKKG